MFSPAPAYGLYSGVLCESAGELFRPTYLMKQENQVCFSKPTNPLASRLAMELETDVLKIILLMPEKIQLASSAGTS